MKKKGIHYLVYLLISAAIFTVIWVFLDDPNETGITRKMILASALTTPWAAWFVLFKNAQSEDAKLGLWILFFSCLGMTIVIWLAITMQEDTTPTPQQLEVAAKAVKKVSGCASAADATHTFAGKLAVWDLQRHEFSATFRKINSAFQADWPMTVFLTGPEEHSFAANYQYGWKGMRTCREICAVEFENTEDDGKVISQHRMCIDPPPTIKVRSGTYGGQYTAPSPDDVAWVRFVRAGKAGNLIWAAQHGHLNLLKALIADGVNVNAKTGDDWQYIINFTYPANIEVQGPTALMQAAGKGNLEIVKALIAAHADVNARDRWGRTALSFAVNEFLSGVKGGHAEVIQALIAAGADAKDIGEGALLKAKEKGYLDLIKALIAAGAAVKGKDGESLLYSAADKGHLGLVQVLIAARINVNARVRTFGQDYSTALSAAVWKGHLEIVQALIAAGADVSDGRPLETAASRGYSEIAITLIAAGVSVDGKTGHGQDALVLAVRHRQLEAVQVLIAAGVDVNPKRCDYPYGYGEPLMEAVRILRTITATNLPLALG